MKPIQPGECVRIITSAEPAVRDRSLDEVCEAASLEELLAECDALEKFRRSSSNLYEQVRALFFLYAIYRFHLPGRLSAGTGSLISYAGYTNLLNRRFNEAIETFLSAQQNGNPDPSLASALAAAYKGLGFQTLADQVRRSVRSVRGNQWMFRAGHSSDSGLKLQPELLRQQPNGLYPVLQEQTPVRMDLTHCGWSDIFFLGMDFPEGAKVLNVSIDLAVREAGTGIPAPPVEAYLRVIDEPVLRLTSVDLKASADVTSVSEVFDFARDYLGLLKSAVIASGLVPPGMEGSTQPLSALLERLTGKTGCGIEIVSKVNNIPKGSRLAVSTNLLACLISVCMRATRQIRTLTGSLGEADRRIVAARAILGEWLGGSGGGWQDSGGVWDGIKLITGMAAGPDDPEYGISRGRLLPSHHVLGLEEVSAATRQKLQDSLILVHGGMAQDVGPILEMVTERYLLRSRAEWAARQESRVALDRIVACLKAGDVRGVAEATQKNFDGTIQTIIPWANNLYTQTLIDRMREAFGEKFWGFWMLGGMAGGGMGFIVDPAVKAEAQDVLQGIMSGAKRSLQRAVPFAMEPVVYNFAINENGTFATLLSGDASLMPPEYYSLQVPPLIRLGTAQLTPARRAELEVFNEACQNIPQFRSTVRGLFDSMLPRRAKTVGAAKLGLHELLDLHGFDRRHHEDIQAGLRSGRLGMSQNRLPSSTLIEDVTAADYLDATSALPDRLRELGEQAITQGQIAVVSLAGGAGSRWTRGAGVVKSISPFCRFAGKYRSFVETHLAKSRKVSRQFGMSVPHVITSSYLTHDAIEGYLQANANHGYEGPLYVSPGRHIGLRMVPTERDLRFAWEQTTHQMLDEQAQKVRESLHSALINWATRTGEAADYTDNEPEQCLHPVGHWFEIPNLFRNGVLSRLFKERPQLRYLLVHNIDTVGASVDPALLGQHIERGAAMTFEVIRRQIEDTGGGLARIEGRPRIIEGLALPAQELEFSLSFYNTNTVWIDLDALLKVFGLTRESLDDSARVSEAIHRMARRIPTYITLKDVKKRWGKAQEDVFPVTQWEKLWVDMTALHELQCDFVAVPRARGQQLKEVSQLDPWLRDGSANYVGQLCDWAE